MERREAIGAAFDSVMKGEEKPEKEEQETLEIEAEAPEKEEPEKEEPEKEEPEKEEPEKEELDKEEPEKEEEDEPEAKDDKEKSDEAESEEAPQRPQTKAPQSWRPEVRAHWSKLPAEVQAEVTKRELEVNRALTNSSNARKLASQFYRVMQPYEHLIRMNNSTPMQTVYNMMQTASVLQLGTPAQKATAIASVIRQFGIDIETLDKVLVNEKVDDTAGAIDRRVAQHMQPMNEFLSRMSAQEVAAAQVDEQRATQELEKFASTHSYFEDLSTDIMGILDGAAAQNRQMTLQTAYDMALVGRPDIKKLIDAEKSVNQNPSIARKKIEKAKKAAAGLGASAPVGGGKKTAPADRREALEAAWDQHA